MCVYVCVYVYVCVCVCVYVCARVCFFLFFFSGKSTLFHLLTRLYEPLRGAVAIDGRDVAE